MLRVSIDLDFGGRKVCIDHGEGLFTTSCHLARSSVVPGQQVARGELIGFSGASGMEFVLCFPWIAPHVHFDAILNGAPHDPFATDDEQSLWRRRNDPGPTDGPAADPDFEPTSWDEKAVDAGIESCRDPHMREILAAAPTVAQRAGALLVQRHYRPTVFAESPSLYLREYPVRPRLDLMFRAEDFVGAAFPTDL